MNLREWARVTHRALANQPPDERQKELSAANVERVLRMSITTLINALIAGDDLRIDELGRLWAESKPPRRTVSNLPGRSQSFTTQDRRRVRFRPSSRLGTLLDYALDADGQPLDRTP